MKPLTTLEVFDLFKKNSSAEVVADIVRRIGCGQLQVVEGDEAEHIIGGCWPSRISGSQRFNCSVCGCYVALSPLSGMAVLAKHPNLPIWCYPCAGKHMDLPELP